MSTTITFSDIPAGVENHATSSTLNTGEEINLEITGVKKAVAHNITPDTTAETKNKIDYQKLVAEHAELIAQGKTSLEIAQWIGDKLNIPSWKAGEFYGERKVLSSPQTEKEFGRLKSFVEALGISFNDGNYSSKNYPQYLLLDAHVQHTLFGSANMTQVDARLNTFLVDWQKMGRDFTAKAKYLLEKIGLDIKGDWSKLTGLRYAVGAFTEFNKIFASGMLVGDNVRVLWLDRYSSDINVADASNAQLCSLA